MCCATYLANGTVKWFNSTKGYGFNTPENGGADVFVHVTAVEKAGSFDVDKVRAAAAGLTFDAPEGTVKIDGDNQHLYKPVRIGKINANGLIDEVYATEPIKPDPFLKSYDWAKGLSSQN